MSIELKEDKQFDPWDYDETRPKKNAPGKTKSWDKDEIDAARDALFETGSEFLPTAREEVVGIDNVLTEIDEVIHWLNNSKQYMKHGARLEPGVIFEGDPGTGKTLVSRYIATESGALFVNVRDFPHAGSLFKDSDIRDLFKRARSTYKKTGRPIVLFWDEFENGAVERSSATPEQVATVSQLTAELDGVHGKNEGVVLIGCTNYIYGIDAALKRSGRMGKQIEFSPPDRAGKALLLKHYVGKYRTTGSIDVEMLSYFMDSDDTAADIEESVMEAWRVAVARLLREHGPATRKKPSISEPDLIDVFMKRLVGPPTAFVNLSLEERHKIAVHEAGHAIMAAVYGVPLRLITVQPGKKSLGRVITAEMNEHMGTMDEYISHMRVCAGSITAEQVAGLPALIGSSGDIKSMNKLAAKLVDTLYAGDLTGLFNPHAVAGVRQGRYDSANPNVSAGAIADSDYDVKALIDKTYADGMLVMEDIGSDQIHQIAHGVNVAVTLTGREFVDLFKSVTGNDPEDYRP